MRFKQFAAAFLSLSCIAVSCQKEQMTEKTEGEVFQITASFESRSKTTLSDNGVSILWEPNEKINVFYGSCGMMFTSINSKPAPVTIFSAAATVLFGSLEGSDEYIYGVYPYSSDNEQNGDTITLTVPDRQYSLEGSFGSGTFPAVGRSKESSMAFFNVCGGICFTVTRADIAGIIFKGNNNESVAGRVTICFDENGRPVVADSKDGAKEVTVLPDDEYFIPGKKYYMSLLPSILENGFSISIYSIKEDMIEIGVINSSQKSEIKRSVFGTIENIDEKTSFDIFSSISLSSESIDIPDSGSSFELEIDSSSEWFINNDYFSIPDWIDVSSMNGDSGKSTITITVSENNGLERTGSILVFNQEHCCSSLEIRQESRTLTKISDVRAIQTGRTIPAGTFIKAVVISNRQLDNLSSLKTLYLQDMYSEDVATAPHSGLYLYCPSNHTLNQGDVILADLSGMTITTYNEALEIVPKSNSFFTIVGNHPVSPIDITYAQLASGAFEDQYVRITDPVQVLESYYNSNWSTSTANSNITLETYAGDLLTVYASKYSTALRRKVAYGSGCICGISSRCNGSSPELVFAKSTDDADLISNRFSSEYEETTVLGALKSINSKVQLNGRILATGPLGCVINDGGNANIYVFTAAEVPFKTGDVVNVKGITSEYYGVKEIHCSSESILASESIIMEKPEQIPVEITSSNINSFVPKIMGNSEHITATGILSQGRNGAYVYVGGSSKVWISSLMDFSQYEGKNVTVTGYWTGTSGDFNTVLESIVIQE